MDIARHEKSIRNIRAIQALLCDIIAGAKDAKIDTLSFILFAQICNSTHGGLNLIPAAGGVACSSNNAIVVYTENYDFHIV